MDEESRRSIEVIAERLLLRQRSEGESSATASSSSSSTLSPDVNRMFEIIEIRSKFPQKLRQGMDEILEELAGKFLFALENKLVDLLYGNAYNPSLARRGQTGLDSEMDTEDQVETAIRYFPNVITRRSWSYNVPIEAQITLRSVAFLPLLAKLGVELGYGIFATEQRGGLVSPEAWFYPSTNASSGNAGGASPAPWINRAHHHQQQRPPPEYRNNGSNHVLIQNLAPHLIRRTNLTSNNFYCRNSNSGVLFELATTTTELQDIHNDANVVERVDKTCMAVIQRLRTENLFFRHDICNGPNGNPCPSWNMVTALCANPSTTFSKERFTYLVNWDPNSLLTPDHEGQLPVHVAASLGCGEEYGDDAGNESENNHESRSSNITHQYLERFKSVLTAGLTHFPIELGGLFHINHAGDSAFRLACQRFGSETVNALFDAVLSAQVLRKQQQGTTTSILQTLVSLASQDVVDMDGLFLMLRREPSTMQLSTFSPF